MYKETHIRVIKFQLLKWSGMDNDEVLNTVWLTVSFPTEHPFSQNVSSNCHSLAAWFESMLSKLLSQSYLWLAKQIIKHHNTLLTDLKLTLLAQLKIQLFERHYLGRSPVSYSWWLISFIRYLWILSQIPEWLSSIHRCYIICYKESVCKVKKMLWNLVLWHLALILVML